MRGLDKKKEKFFMPFTERKIIIENLSCVDQVISFEDDENGSQLRRLNMLKKSILKMTILFANGGDRNIEGIFQKCLFKELSFYLELEAMIKRILHHGY